MIYSSERRTNPFVSASGIGGSLQRRLERIRSEILRTNPQIRRWRYNNSALHAAWRFALARATASNSRLSPRNASETTACIDAVEFGRFDEGVDDSGAFAAGIGAREEPVLAAEGYTPDGSFSGIVIDLDAAIMEITPQGFPAAHGIAHGLGDLPESFGRVVSSHVLISASKGDAFSWRTRLRSSGGFPRISSSMP